MENQTLYDFLREKKEYSEDFAKFISGLVEFGFSRNEDYNPLEDRFISDIIKEHLAEYYKQKGRESQKD